MKYKHLVIARAALRLADEEAYAYDFYSYAGLRALLRITHGSMEEASVGVARAMLRGRRLAGHLDSLGLSLSVQGAQPAPHPSDPPKTWGSHVDGHSQWFQIEGDTLAIGRSTLSGFGAEFDVLARHVAPRHAGAPVGLDARS